MEYLYPDIDIKDILALYGDVFSALQDFAFYGMKTQK